MKEPHPTKTLHSGWSVDLFEGRYIFNNGEFVITRSALEDYANSNNLRLNYQDPVNILNLIYRESL